MSFPFPFGVVPTAIPVPGSHVIHIHHTHTVGPYGANGTQQFPKLTDRELISILKPLIHGSIIDVYCTKGGKTQNAQNILTNLQPIVECTKKIFQKVKAEHGYCSCECIGAMQRNQAAQGQACDFVYRALMVAFSFADLHIQMAKIDKKDTLTVIPAANYPTDFVDPHNGVYHQNSPSPQDREKRLRELIESLEKLHNESRQIQEAITRESQQR